MFRNKFLNFNNALMIAMVFVVVLTATLVACADAEHEEEVVLNVEGMTCGACEDVVKSALLKCDGVKDVEVSHKEGKAVVQKEGSEAKTDELIKAVEKAGFTASKS